MNPSTPVDKSGGQQVEPNQNTQNAGPQLFQSSVIRPQTMPYIPASQPVQLPKDKPAFLRWIPIVILSLLLIGASVFAGWAFMERQDYKNNSDQMTAIAVEKALGEQKVTLDAEFAEKMKVPLDTYSGKPESGSVVVQYPRSWSAYVDEESNSSSPIVGYFHPGYVPYTQNNNAVFALRVEVLNTQYVEVMKQTESLVKQGGVTLAPYTFPKVSNQLGSVLRGKIIQGKEKVDGTMVIMPIRDKTLKIWTESNAAFGKDFTESILPNVTFVP